jgi:hypothetical protein
MYHNLFIQKLKRNIFILFLSLKNFSKYLEYTNKNYIIAMLSCQY